MTHPDSRSDPDERDLDPEQLLARAEENLDNQEREHLSRDESESLDALRRAQQKLWQLVDVSRELNTSDGVDDALNRILRAALEISRGDRAYVLRKSREGILTTLASSTRDGTPADPGALTEISHTILDSVLTRGKTLHLNDALSDPDFGSSRSVRALSLRSVVCVPLRLELEVTGALYVDSQSVTGLLGVDEVRLLEAFGVQAAIALDRATLTEELTQAAENLEAENRSLREALGERTKFNRILGRSEAMKRVFLILDRVVENPVTVLIQGETGTGKELVAQALHFNGPRAQGNFIPVNCGAFAESLLESELFGVSKGAFTGADRDRQGLVEAASGGTLFLDELAELSPALQVKLLRVLQEGEVRRLGENKARKVDVRIVAATHRDLSREVRDGRFRQDLYYRINVISVTLPPLREREEDVLLLADQFLNRQRVKLDRPELRFSREARRLLMTYTWPGNVRELINVVERASALSQDDLIQPDDLSPEMRSARSTRPARDGSLKLTLQRAEAEAIRDALETTGGNISQAAKLLEVSRQHLHTRIRRLELEVHR